MQIILYEKQENGKRVRVRYNFNTEHISIDSRYINIEKESMYRQEHKREIRKYRQEHKKEAQEYRCSEKGKLSHKKHKAKRKRNLGFTILIENQFNCGVDYHHINNEYVVAVPKYIHQGTLGKNHRAECNILVEKLYDINIEKEVEKYENKI